MLPWFGRHNVYLDFISFNMLVLIVWATLINKYRNIRETAPEVHPIPCFDVIPVNR